MAAVLNDAIPVLLGAGGITTIATLVVQAISGRASHGTAERQLIADQWASLMAAAVTGYNGCLEREKDLRERVEALEAHRADR